MAYTVKLTALAEADVYKAFEYIREDAPIRAEEWLIGLFQTIDTLDEMPRRCAIISEARDLGREVHQLLYGSYRILFDIEEETPEGPLVRVLRIWHGARNRIRSSDLEVE